MLSRPERLHTIDLQEIGTYSIDLCTHLHKHPAKLLQVWLAGSIIDSGLTFRKTCSHDDIGCTGHRRLIQKHVLSLQRLAFRHMEIERLLVEVILLRRTEIHETHDMGIHPATADLIPAWLREKRTSETGQKRSNDHNGTTQLRALAHEVRTCDIISIDLVGLEGIDAFFMSCDLHAHALQKQDQITHVQDLRNIRNLHLLLCQEHCADHLQGLILRALRPYGTTKLVAAFYNE